MITTTPPSFAVGSWSFSAAHGESVRILDVETVWSDTIYQVRIPRLAAVERVPAESLSPAQPAKATSISHRKKRTRERDNLLERQTERQIYTAKIEWIGVSCFVCSVACRGGNKGERRCKRRWPSKTSR